MRSCNNLGPMHKDLTVLHLRIGVINRAHCKNVFPDAIDL